MSPPISPPISRVTAPVPKSVPTISKDRIIDWLGIAPFMLFALLFLLAPTFYLVVGAFFTPDGQLTLKNISDLFTPSILSAYWISIRISLAPTSGRQISRSRFVAISVDDGNGAALTERSTSPG